MPRLERFDWNFNSQFTNVINNASSRLWKRIMPITCLVLRKRERDYDNS